MSILILVLAMKSGNMGITSTNIQLNVDVANCEQVFIPKVKSQYATSPLQVISAKCFPTN